MIKKKVDKQTNKQTLNQIKTKIKLTPDFKRKRYKGHIGHVV